MMRLIEEKRKSGVFLSVLGFGMGNYKDSKMEVLADKGNGNYAYIDNLLEARKVLVEQMGGTLHVLAKDVKLQVEFNPARVSAYRLVGYENRMLKSEDFNDDTKDAGELGAGHSVTALYEIVPVGTKMPLPTVDPLKYGTRSDAEEIDQPGTPRGEKRGWFRRNKPAKDISGELLTVKFRYKKPNENNSQLITRVLKDANRSMEQATENLRFAAAVAGFGMLLRNSEHKGTLTYEKVAALAEGARSQDPEGYRAEFLRLAKLAGSLSRGKSQTARGE
jgi:Ca-activated chloride channel family protein